MLEFIKTNKNMIIAVVGALLTVCGIIMMVTALLENKKAKQIVVAEEVPALVE